VGVIALDENLTPIRVIGAVLVLLGVTALAQFSRTTQN
jgi:drug/metabolite transporter (DMT)-like permease